MTGLAGRERGLGCRQTGDWHPVGRAGDVVQANLMTERDRARLSAMLAAHPALEPALRPPPARDGHPHQLAHPGAVDLDERVCPVDAATDVLRQEAARIVAGKPEAHLGEIVRAER